MRPRTLIWGVTGFFAFCAAALAFGLTILWPEPGRSGLSLAQLALPLASVVCLLFFFSGWLLDYLLAKPLERLALQLKHNGHRGPAKSLSPPRTACLGELPARVMDMDKQLHAVRAELDFAVSGNIKKSDLHKRRLENILRDLDKGIIVTDKQHKILYYNPAAADILTEENTIRPGAYLEQLFAEAPLAHALSKLDFSQVRYQDDNEFICAAKGGGVVMQCRLNRFALDGGNDKGLILFFQDVTRRFACRKQQDRIFNMLLRNLRRPITNLRAVIETLTDYPDMEPRVIWNFYNILKEESLVLDKELGAATHERTILGAGQWFMNTVYSDDLLACLDERLAKQQLVIKRTGNPVWLNIDSYNFLLLLEFLLNKLKEWEKNHLFDIEVYQGKDHAYVDLCWQGQVVPVNILNSWQKEQLPGAFDAICVEDVLNAHETGLWSKAHGSKPGYAVLHLPLALILKNPPLPQNSLPPRPEFYHVPLPGISGDFMFQQDMPLNLLECVAFDIETTGLYPGQGDRILALGAVRIIEGKVVRDDIFYHLINPECPIPKESTGFHGISDDMVANKPAVDKVLPLFEEFVGNRVLIGYNPVFDMQFMQHYGKTFSEPVLDILLLSFFLHGDSKEQSLEAIAERFGVDTGKLHSAEGDALICADIFIRLIELLALRNIATLADTVAVQREMFELRKEQQQIF